MDVKPDPKPGRWILPLIIVAMVGFTYVFVNSIELGGDDGGSEGIDIETSTTSFPVIDTSEPDDGGGGELDPETAAYVELINGFDAELNTVAGDFVTANDAWDDKTATYSETVDAFTAGIGELDAWAATVAASTAPTSRPELADLHQAIVDASGPPVTYAQEALDWLQSTESGTGAKRQEAVANMETSVAAFSDAVGAAVAAASG